MKAGYGPTGQLFERQHIQDAWQEWAQIRHGEEKLIVGVVIGVVEDIHYSFVKDGVLQLYSEPIVAVYGEVSSYQEHASDDEIIETLHSLFAYLGKKLLQTTVRVRYDGDNGFRISYRLRLPDTEHPLD